MDPLDIYCNACCSWHQPFYPCAKYDAGLQSQQPAYTPPVFAGKGSLEGKAQAYTPGALSTQEETDYQRISWVPDWGKTNASLPTNPTERKKAPMARGLLDYFPKALAEVARCSMIANEQHSPGEPMHWAREKSTDEADCIVRHLVDRGKLDSDGIRHSAKVAWRGLALLERELDGEKV